MNSFFRRFFDTLGLEINLKGLVASFAGLLVLFILLIVAKLLVGMFGYDLFSDNGPFHFLSPEAAFILIIFLISFRVGDAIYCKNIRGDVSEKGEIAFQATLMGGAFFIVLASIKNLVLEHGILGWVFDFAIAGLIYSAMRCWHNKKIATIDDEYQSARMGHPYILIMLLFVSEFTGFSYLYW